MISGYLFNESGEDGACAGDKAPARGPPPLVEKIQFRVGNYTPDRPDDGTLAYHKGEKGASVAVLCAKFLEVDLGTLPGKDLTGRTGARANGSWLKTCRVFSCARYKESGIVAGCAGLVQHEQGSVVVIRSAGRREVGGERRGRRGIGRPGGRPGWQRPGRRGPTTRRRRKRCPAPGPPASAGSRG